jgi:hypothetical protein
MLKAATTNLLAMLWCIGWMLLPVTGPGVARGFVYLTLGHEVNFSLPLHTPLVPLAIAALALLAFILISRRQTSSPTALRLVRVATAVLVFLLALSLRYRLLALLPFVVAAAGLCRAALQPSKSWRCPGLILLLAAALLLSPLDVSLRTVTGGPRILQVEDGLWYGRPPDPDSSGIVRLCCYGQHPPHWLVVW